MKTVSIVMPLYRAEAYMKAAVRSVLAQTYPHWELLLVEDGSPDSSGRIADALARRYPDRIRVLHQENKGQGGARNAGAAAARGDFLFFMDSDDTVDPRLLELCVYTAVQQKADVVTFEYDIHRADGSYLKSVKNPFALPQTGDTRLHREFLLTAPMVWNKLIRTEFYRRSGVSFPENVWYEDLILCTKLMADARCVVYLPHSLYRYHLRPNSTMRNVNLDRNREIVTAMEEIVRFFSERGLRHIFADELCCIALDNVYIASSLRLIRIDPKTPLLGELRAYMQKEFPDYARNPYLPRMSPAYRLAFRLLEWRMTDLLSLLTCAKDRKGRL